MRASILLGLSLGLALTASPAISQEASVGAVHSHIDGIAIPPIANAPFSARVVVTWDQPLVGGGTASRKYYTLVARDTQGRVRRETRGFVPAGSDSVPPLRSFTVLDPVSGTHTTCTKSSMTCATSALNSQMLLTEDAAGNNGNSNSESLGQQTIDGLPVTGTRETMWNSSGSRSTSRLALSHADVWYSPDLHMDLSVTRDDPQLGEVTLTVTDLVQGEPNPTAFAIPSGYVLMNSSPR